MNQIFDTGLLSTNEFSDFDHMAVTAASIWGQRYCKLQGAQEYGFAHQLNLPSAQLTHIGWQPGIHIESGTPADSIGFVLQMSQRGRMRANGKLLAANEILVMHDPRDYDLLNPPETSYLVLAVEKERVRRHIESLWGDLPGPFSDISRLISPANFQQGKLASVFHSQLELAYHESHAISRLEDQGVSNIVDELLDTLLLSSEAARPEGTMASRHRLARRAIDYLHENMDGIVTVRSMCEHVGVCERSLRQGFLERFGVAPKTYIKQHRLNCLRQVLKQSTPAQTSVTQAALGSGLTHMGRLAAEYRAFFGESPYQTLHRPMG